MERCGGAIHKGIALYNVIMLYIYVYIALFILNVFLHLISFILHHIL